MDKILSEWYIVETDGIYNAVRKRQSYISDRNYIETFKDWNNQKLDLGTNKEWAQNFVDTRNEIEYII